MRALEALLGITRSELRAIAADVNPYYRPFSQKKKPKPFQKKPISLKVRQIDQPIGKLLDAQRVIYRKILKPIAIPYYLFGGIKGRTVLDNVMLHFGSPQIITLDIQNFFPSVTRSQVYGVWRHVLGCSSRIASLLTNLTVYEGRLPQGAPTSTLLANLVIHSIDSPIRIACEDQAVRYSTWVDDLAFSGEHPGTVFGCVIAVLAAHGFVISRKKLKIMGPGTRHVLNGVLMGKFPSVLRETLANIRSGIHKLQTGMVTSRDNQAYIRSLAGRISQVGILRPDKAVALRKSLEVAVQEQRLTNQ